MDALARLADALTLSRVVLAAALVVALGRNRDELAVVLLCLAWVTDFLDGRLARASGTSTRLGEWDLAADTLVGAGLLIGFAIGGYLDARLVVLFVVVFGGGYLLTRNIALSQILQAIGYGAMLWRLWSRGSPVRWVPVVVIAVIGVANRRKLVHETLPEFFGGVAEVARMHLGSSVRTPGERR